MEWIQVVILGIIQGLTEFLPISSSGHLVLAQHFMGIKSPGVFLEVILHMGTLCAILIYYYDDIRQLIYSAYWNQGNSRMYFIQLIIATIPVLFVGLLLKDMIEVTFTVLLVRYMLMITGILVGSTYFFKNRSRKELILISAFCIGIAQVFALLPGISRSGMTISVALILGIQHDKAAKFAFFMAIPVLMGAGILQVFTINFQSNLSVLTLLSGFISSAVTGYLVINWLLSVISRGKFYIFSLYCFMVSIFAYITIN